MLIPKSRIEWFSIFGGLITILIVLIYCGYIIHITHDWLAEHRRYIRQRDERWEPLIDELEQHLLRQDDHLLRQDKDSANLKVQQITILKNQAEILTHIHNEEKLWPKVKP